MLLFILRLFTSEFVFLSLFLLVPLMWVAFSIPKWFRGPLLGGEIINASHNVLFASLLAIGIVGATLVRAWDWAVPITAVSILLALLQSTKFARDNPMFSLLYIGLLPATWLALSNRNEFWWRTAEGIPFDETILESVSKGLIHWGPTVNPLHHGLDGASAAAYHHLLYITVGLIDKFAHPGPYEALLLLAPIVSGLSICLTLVLMVRVLLRTIDDSAQLSPSVLLGLVACLLGLRGEGFGSPSTWFGIASLAASLLIVAALSQKNPNYRDLILVAFSTITVAFSKGVFIYATVLIAVSIAVLDLRTRWKIAATALVTAVGVVAWFSWASVVVDQFYIDFWPYRNFQSEFSFDFYTFRVFFYRLISPILVGVSSAVLLRYSKLPRVRQLGFPLFLILVAAVVSQLFITSTGARSFELLYVPGIFAASVLVLVLAVSTNNFPGRRSQYVLIVFVSGLIIVGLMPPIGNGIVNPFTIAAAFVGIFICWLWLENRFVRDKYFFGADLSLGLASLFLTLITVIALVSQDLPDFPRYSREFMESETSNWLGSPAFNEAVDFIQSETASNSLFAFSVCDRDLSKSCEVDFRPAALTSRRFLALDPLFSRDAVDVRTWGDVELSQAIGALPASKVVDDLIARGVNYVLIDHSRVSSEWIQNAKDVGAMEVFSSTSYSVLQLNVS
jgi:hypothetical protein